MHQVHHTHNYGMYNPYTYGNTNAYAYNANPYKYQEYGSDKPSEYNGTADFHNTEDYWKKGFAGQEEDYSSNYNNVRGYGGWDHHGHEQPEEKTKMEKDWWMHLVKDQHDGMASARIGKMDLEAAAKAPGFMNTNDFDRLRVEALNEEARRSGAAIAKSKETEADKELVKELDESGGAIAGTVKVEFKPPREQPHFPKKPEAPKEKEAKEETKAEAAPAEAAAAEPEEGSEGWVPPELRGPMGMSQQTKPVEAVKEAPK